MISKKLFFISISISNNRTEKTDSTVFDIPPSLACTIFIKQDRY